MTFKRQWNETARSVMLKTSSLAGLLLLTAASASPATAAVLNVDNNGACSDVTGAPYCTIKAAAAVAVAGDVVQVASGTYSGVVTVSRSGAAGSPITFTTSEGAIVTSNSYGFDLKGTAWVVVQGFTISGSTYDGIRCTLCSNVQLLANTVVNSNGKGIGINSSSDTLVSGNAVDAPRLTGIDVAGSTRITIRGGYVAHAGLRISGKTYKGIKFATSSDSLVEYTDVFDNSDTGIYLLDGATGIRVRKVTSHHNARTFDRAAAGIESRSDGNIAESNVTYSNEDSGINMRWGGSNGLIVNNVSYSNGDHGIDVLESPSPRIFHNSVYGNVTAGINVEGNSTNAIILNNISIDNGINSPRTLGDIRVTTSSMPATADFNIVWGSDGGYIYHWNGTYYRNLSSLTNVNPGVESRGLQTLAGWASPQTGDLTLTAGSAAIDSAKSNTGAAETAVDSLGNARCDDLTKANTGAGPVRFADRGAFEYLNSCAE